MKEQQKIRPNGADFKALKIKTCPLGQKDKRRLNKARPSLYLMGMNHSIEIKVCSKLVGVPGIEPGPCGPKPQTLPLCYPPKIRLNNSPPSLLRSYGREKSCYQIRYTHFVC